MYLDYYSFSEKPFSNTPDLQFFFRGSQHEHALEALCYGIRDRHGFLLLTGEVGAGKTTLTRALLERLDQSVATSLLINPLLSVPELLHAMAKDFGLSIRSHSPQRLIEGLNQFLLKLVAEQRTALVIIDESQNLSYEALEAVRMLTNLETEKQKLLQILLVGQPELVQRLQEDRLRQLRQRVGTSIHLRPMERRETARYINHRLSVVGGGGKVFFEHGAYRRIHRASQGYPRLVNLIADRSLLAAYVRESRTVEGSDVNIAVSDIQGVSRFSVRHLFRRLVLSGG